MRRVFILIFCLQVFWAGTSVSYPAQDKDNKNPAIEASGSVDKAPTQIRDIRGPKNFPDRSWFYALLSLVILLFAAAVVGFIILKRRYQEHISPPLPAHVIAYRALRVLDEKDYIRNRQIKAYYIELSDIVRHYLENRFNIRAPQMSTEEFLIKVKEDNDLSSEHKGLLREFLGSCDLVKFAKYEPIEQEATSSMLAARRLIDQTKEEEHVVG